MKTKNQRKGKYIQKIPTRLPITVIASAGLVTVLAYVSQEHGICVIPGSYLTSLFRFHHL